MPSNHRWVLYPQPNKVRNIRAMRRVSMDFFQVKNPIYREDLKEYIWSLDEAPYDSRLRFSRLVDFLNEADLYDVRENKLSYINNQQEICQFSSTFLFLYYARIQSSIGYADSTKNHIVSNIRHYLEEIKSKYNISSLTIKQLSYIDVDRVGGKPILKEDYKEILCAFEEASIQSIENKLSYIIFLLSYSTKLRIGEILSLRRNCIISKDEERGYGIIRYQSKISGGKFVDEVLLIEQIRLIENAISLTHPVFEQANDIMKNYAFITFDRSTNRKGLVIFALNVYKDHFRAIIKALSEKNKIKEKYIPYNARDTYVDTAWQGVEDGVISPMEIGAITGNRPETAIKSYRDQNNVIRYLEAAYETVIDKPVNGYIENEEYSIEHLPPVQQDAGACASAECIKYEVDIEDSEFICLTCKKFVTTLERAPLFEKRIQLYKEKKDSSTTKIEKNYYSSLLELYGAYLSEIYYRLENENE